jgi:hypothetical protein
MITLLILLLIYLLVEYFFEPRFDLVTKGSDFLRIKVLICWYNYKGKRKYFTIL